MNRIRAGMGRVLYTAVHVFKSALSVGTKRRRLIRMVGLWEVSIPRRVCFRHPSIKDRFDPHIRHIFFAIGCEIVGRAGSGRVDKLHEELDRGQTHPGQPRCRSRTRRLTVLVSSPSSRNHLDSSNRAIPGPSSDSSTAQSNLFKGLRDSVWVTFLRS